MAPIRNLWSFCDDRTLFPTTFLPLVFQKQWHLKINLEVGNKSHYLRASFFPQMNRSP